MLRSIVYVSAATVPFELAGLLALLEQSRASNAREGLTGLLLYRDGNFMQALEGDPAAVGARFARIAADPRHHRLITLLDEAIPVRQFGEWAMGFRNLSLPETLVVEGFSDFMNTPFTGEALAGDPARAARLLREFKRLMR